MDTTKRSCFLLISIDCYAVKACDLFYLVLRNIVRIFSSQTEKKKKLIEISFAAEIKFEFEAMPRRLYSDRQNVQGNLWGVEMGISSGIGTNGLTFLNGPFSGTF